MICFELGKGAMSEAGKYLFRAANVWWSVRSILLLPLAARCLKTIDVCIWCMFVFTVVVTVWGYVVMFFCVAAVVKYSGFLALEC